MKKSQEKTTVSFTNTVIKDQIESIREKIAEIKLPIVNDNHKLNTVNSEAAPEKFDFPPDLDSSEAKVIKVFSGVISQDFFGQNPAGYTIDVVGGLAAGSVRKPTGAVKCISTRIFIPLSLFCDPLE